MTALFISDLHLGPDTPAVVESFRHFLSGPARKAKSLTILGDLFEVWAGDDDLTDPFNAARVAELAALAQTGVQVFFMRGNRDCLIGEVFAQAAGLTLLDDPATLTLGGQPTILMHGDTLCTDDVAYQAFRATVRDPAWQAQFLAQPLAQRKAFIAGVRSQSEQAKQQKSMTIMDVNADAVLDALRRHGCTRLIHGHTHRPQRHALVIDGLDCERWVLADWCHQPAYLKCDDSGCEVVRL